MYTAQLLEHSMLNLAAGLFMTKAPVITRQVFDATFSDLDRKTLGALMKAARGLMSIPSEIDVLLSQSQPRIRGSSRAAGCGGGAHSAIDCPSIQANLNACAIHGEGATTETQPTNRTVLTSGQFSEPVPEAPRPQIVRRTTSISE